jgi:aliphatic nitrilase
LVVGVNERDGNTCYNTLLFIDRKGSILGKHRKLMPTHEERTVWGMGDGSDLVVFDTDVGKLSGLICWEHTMNLVRHALYTMGEQVHCAVWTGASALRGWEKLFNMGTEISARYHAHVGECFVINVQNTSDEATKQVLCETDEQKESFRVGGGWTAIIAPGGEMLAGPLKDKEGILYADLDLNLIVDWALWHDAVGHYARNDVVSLVINREKYSAAKEAGTQYAPLVRKPNLEGLKRSFQSLKAKIEAGENEELKKLAQELEAELSMEGAL